MRFRFTQPIGLVSASFLLIGFLFQAMNGACDDPPETALPPTPIPPPTASPTPAPTPFDTDPRLVPFNLCHPYVENDTNRDGISSNVTEVNINTQTDSALLDKDNPILPTRFEDYHLPMNVPSREFPVDPTVPYYPDVPTWPGHQDHASWPDKYFDIHVDCNVGISYLETYVVAFSFNIPGPPPLPPEYEPLPPPHYSVALVWLPPGGGTPVWHYIAEDTYGSHEWSFAMGREGTYRLAIKADVSLGSANLAMKMVAVGVSSVIDIPTTDTVYQERGYTVLHDLSNECCPDSGIALNSPSKFFPIYLHNLSNAVTAFFNVPGGGEEIRQFAISVGGNRFTSGNHFEIPEETPYPGTCGLYNPTDLTFAIPHGVNFVRGYGLLTTTPNHLPEESPTPTVGNNPYTLTVLPVPDQIPVDNNDTYQTAKFLGCDETASGHLTIWAQHPTESFDSIHDYDHEYPQIDTKDFPDVWYSVFALFAGTTVTASFTDSSYDDAIVFLYGTNYSDPDTPIVLDPGENYSEFFNGVGVASYTTQRYCEKVFIRLKSSGYHEQALSVSYLGDVGSSRENPIQEPYGSTVIDACGYHPYPGYRDIPGSGSDSIPNSTCATRSRWIHTDMAPYNSMTVRVHANDAAHPCLAGCFHYSGHDFDQLVHSENGQDIEFTYANQLPTFFPMDIQINDSPDATVHPRIEFEATPIPPPNDAPCDALSIEGGGHREGYLTLHANDSGFVPSCASPGGDVWYRLAPPDPGTVIQAQYFHGTAWGAVSMFTTENECDQPTQRACGYDHNTLGTASVSFTTTAPNQEVLIQIRAASTSGINTQALDVTLTPLSNDEKTDATSISCGYSVAGGITSGATPSASPSANPCSLSNMPDVWYVYTSPAGYPDPVLNYGYGPRLTISFDDDPYYGGLYYNGFIALYEEQPDGSLRLVDWRCDRHDDSYFTLSVDCAPACRYFIRIGSPSPSPNKTFTFNCFSKL